MRWFYEENYIGMKTCYKSEMNKKKAGISFGSIYIHFAKELIKSSEGTTQI